MPARFACYLVAMAVVTAAAEAEAEPPLLVEGQVALHYRRAPNAAPECPDEKTFRERAADGFEFRDPFTAGDADAPARMRVEITRTAGDFLATVFSVSAAGYAVSTERATGCDDLVWRLGLRMERAIHRALGTHAEKRFRLDYMRPPKECVTEVDFRRMVARQGDGKDRFYDDGTLTVSVTYEKLPSGRFRATIEHPGAKDGSEVQTHAHCETLGFMVAVAVYRFVPAPDLPTPAPPPAAAPALTCDPYATAANGQEQIAELARKLEEYGRRMNQQDERIEDIEAKNLALRKALDEAKKNNRMDLTGWLTTGIFVTANLTSNVGPGMYFGGAARSGPISLGLEARFVIPSPVNVGTTKAGEKLDFDLSQVVGLLTPCGHYSYFFGCAVAGAGVEVHHDANFSTPFTTSYPVLQFGGRVGVEIPFGESPFGARAWGEVLYSTPPTAERYHIGGIVYEADRPDVAAFFGLGFVVRLGGKEVK